jgi:hypothetical protein
MPTPEVKVAGRTAPQESAVTALPDIAHTLQSVFDPFGIIAAIFQSQQAWAQHPQEWLRAVDKLARDAGALQAPPPIETAQYPALCAAPGTYVLER